jgi:hypothetical protein
LELEAKIEHYDSLIGRLRQSDDVNRLRILSQYFDSPDIVGQFQERTIPKATPPGDQETSDSSDIFEEITLDGGGNLCFYGATSLYHWTLGPEDQVSPSNSRITIGVSAGPQPPEARSIPSLLSCNMLSSPRMVIGDVDINSSLLHTLLDTYWCFPHHLHLVLSRRLFMGEGENFSVSQPILLIVNLR